MIMKAFYTAPLAMALLSLGITYGDTTLYSDLTSWESAFLSPTVELTTSATTIALANEVGSAPANNSGLGNSLTFESGNTGFTFDVTVEATQTGVTGAGFTFNDTEGDSAWLTGVLSVGDINNAEEDGFEITSSSALFGIYLDFIGNEFSSGESISLYNGGDLVASFTSSGQIPDDPGAPQRTFWGVTSTDPFTRLVFVESPDGDDIGIADIGFSTTAAIPEAATLPLVLSAFSAMFLILRFWKKRPSSVN